MAPSVNIFLTFGDSQLNFTIMICSACNQPCTVVALDNSFDYAGTHCTYGRAGTHRPEGYGAPVSDCCEADCTDNDGAEYEWPEE